MAKLQLVLTIFLARVTPVNKLLISQGILPKDILVTRLVDEEIRKAVLGWPEKLSISSKQRKMACDTMLKPPTDVHLDPKKRKV